MVSTKIRSLSRSRPANAGNATSRAVRPTPARPMRRESGVATSIRYLPPRVASSRRRDPANSPAASARGASGPSRIQRECACAPGLKTPVERRGGEAQPGVSRTRCRRRAPARRRPARSLTPSLSLHRDRSHNAGHLRLCMQQDGVEHPFRSPSHPTKCQPRQLHSTLRAVEDMDSDPRGDQLLTPNQELSAQVHASLTGRREGRSPRGRSTSTAKKARCPARICHSGSILAPMAWATPMMMPPTSVPHRLPKPADDDGLEGVEQACRPDGRVEIGAHAEIERGDGDHHHGDGGGEREDVAVVDAHQLGDLRIVGGGAEGAAELGAVEHEVERQDHADRRGERQELHGAEGDAAAERNRGGLDGAGLEALAVGGEDLEQPVLDDDGEPEGDEKRRQDVPAERAVEQVVLERIAERE